MGDKQNCKPEGLFPKLSQVLVKFADFTDIDGKFNMIIICVVLLNFPNWKKIKDLNISLKPVPTLDQVKINNIKKTLHKIILISKLVLKTNEKTHLAV
jgi:hypothetical protein